MSHGNVTELTLDNPGTAEFDTDDAEIIATPVVKADPSLLFAVFYDGVIADLDADFSRDNGTLAPVATADNPVLDLRGSLDLRKVSALMREVRYDAALNATAMLQQGCVRLGLIFDYDGVPPANAQRPFDVRLASNAAAGVTIEHTDVGRVLVTMRDLTGSQILAADLGDFVAVKGERVEWEWNFDFESAVPAQRMFTRGQQQGDTLDAAAQRGGELVDEIEMGFDSATQDFRVDYVAIFDAVQHSAPYTVEGEAGLLDPDASTGDARLTSDEFDTEVLFAARYNREIGDIDADFSSVSGDLTGTPNGATPTTDGANLELLAGLLQSLRVDYVAASVVFTNPNQGSIRLRTNVVDRTTGKQRFFHMSGGGGANNVIEIEWDSVLGINGKLKLRMTEDDGTEIVNAEFGESAILSGVSLEIEIRWDLDNFGFVSVHKNGVSEIFQVDTAGPERRNNSIDLLRIGDFAAGAGGQATDFEMDFFAVLDASSTGLPIGEAGLGGGFTADTVSVTPNLRVLANGFDDFDADFDAPPSTAVRFTILKNGAELWFNGSAWVPSTSELTDTNTLVEVKANASALVFTGPALLGARAWLTGDGSATPILRSMTINSVFVEPDFEDPAETFVSGRYLGPSGPLAGKTITFEHDGFFHGGNFIGPASVVDVTNSEGKWSVQVTETETIDESPWRVTLEGPPDARLFGIQIPNSGTATFEEVVGR